MQMAVCSSPKTCFSPLRLFPEIAHFNSPPAAQPQFPSLVRLAQPQDSGDPSPRPRAKPTQPTSPTLVSDTMTTLQVVTLVN